jgi:hypothetical protein
MDRAGDLVDVPPQQEAATTATAAAATSPPPNESEPEERPLSFAEQSANANQRRREVTSIPKIATSYASQILGPKQSTAEEKGGKAGLDHVNSMLAIAYGVQKHRAPIGLQGLPRDTNYNTSLDPNMGESVTNWDHRKVPLGDLGLPPEKEAATAATAQTPEQKLREVNAKIDLMTGTKESLPTTKNPNAPIGTVSTGKGETGPRGLEGANQLQALDQERQQLMASRESAKTGPQPVSEFKKNAQAEIDKKYQEALAKNEAEYLAIADPSHVNSPDVQKNIQEISEKRSRVNAQKEAMDLYFGPEMSYAPVDIPGLSDRKIQSFDKPKENPTVQENFRKSRELLFDDKQAKEDAKNSPLSNILDTARTASNAIFDQNSISTVGHEAIATIQDSVLAEEGRTFKSNIKKNMNLRQQLQGYASGGLISYLASGGSPKGSDTVPAMLTPGEFVMKKDSVSKYGKSFMEKMNKGGVVPGFADGGYVGYYAEGGNATIRNRRARGMYDGQMATTAQAMQRSVGMRQNMMSNQFANNPAVQQGVMANPMQKPATGGGNTTGAVGGGMSDAAQQFSQFVTQFSDAAKMMTGMTMTHKVTVDGQLNIGGIDGNAVAEQIKIAIGNYVGKIVEDKMSKKMGEAT